MSTTLEDLKKTNLNTKLDDFCKTLNWLIFNNLEASNQKAHNETGLVISLEGKWGSGKSFFLDYFEQTLTQAENRIKNFVPKTRTNTRISMNNSLAYTEQGQSTEVMVIRYNAYRNDHFEDPFLSLIGEILAGVDNQAQKISLAQVGEALGKGFLYGAASLVPGLKEGLKAVEDNVSQQSVNTLNKSMSAYQAFISLQNEFKAALSTLGEKQIAEAKDKTPATPPIKLIIIDELDRCRPDFAISLLERVKHFFQVKNVVFLLALDIEALHAIIKKVYGHAYDAENYLSRFFDYSLALPADEEFTNAIIDKKTTQLGDNYLLKKLVTYFKLQAREIFKLIDLLLKLQQIGSHLDIIYFLATLKVHSHKKLQRVIEFKPQFSNEEQLKSNLNEFLSLFSMNDDQHQFTNLVLDEKVKDVMRLLFCYLAQESNKNIYTAEYLNEMIKKSFPKHNSTVQNSYGDVGRTIIPLLKSLVI